MSSRTIHLKLDQTSRSIQLDTSLQPASIQKLRDVIIQTFLIPANGNHVIKLKYIDEEEDLITISSDTEFQEALNTLSGPIHMIIDVTPPLLNTQQQQQSGSESEAELVENYSDNLALPSYDDLLKAGEAHSTYVSAVASSSSLLASSTSSSSTMVNSSVASSNSSSTSLNSSQQKSDDDDEDEDDDEENEQQRQGGEGRGKQKSREEENIDDELPPYDNPVPPPPEKREAEGIDFENIANEFHFHRLLIQTAFESAFQNFQSGSSSDSRTESFLDFLSELGRDIGASVRRQELGRRISEGLEEFGQIAEPLFSGIKESFLEFLSNSLLPQQRVGFESNTTDEHIEEQPEEKEDKKEGEQQEEVKEIKETETQEKKEEEEEKKEEEVKEEEEENHQKEESEDGFVHVEDEEQVNNENNTQNNNEDNNVDDINEESFEFVEALTQLEGMGFWGSTDMKAALIAANGDVNQALDSLVN